MRVISIQPGGQPSDPMSRREGWQEREEGLCGRFRVPGSGGLPFSQPSTVSSLIACPVV